MKPYTSSYPDIKDAHYCSKLHANKQKKKTVNGYSPTSASMTVRSGAAGKAMATFRSNICSKSTGERKQMDKENEESNNT